MPRSEQEFEEIREKSTKKILSAAARVIAAKGTAVTIAEVATEAGISQGLAYRYFPSKEAIFYELLRQMMKTGGIVNTSPQMRGTPKERLEQIITDTIQLRKEHPEFYQFLFQAMIAERLPKDIRDTFNEHGRDAHKIIRRLIVEGQAEGEIVKDDPDQLTDTILACLDGLSRKMASLNPDEVKLPEPRIILRMLKPERRR